MSKLRVLISGASIAGPTAAYWLAKAGADVTIIERFPQLRAGGQNVDIRTVGVTVMRKMTGMEAAVRSKRAPIDGISIVDTNGEPFGTLKNTGDPNQQSLVSDFEIFRGDLARVLFDLTKDNPNIKYVFGEQISSIQQSKLGNGPATVEFANGLPTAQFDLVVACDGATSRTRAMGLGCGVRDHVETTGLWAAFYSVQKDMLGGSKIGQAYCAPGGRFIAMGSDHSGVSRITVMNMQPRGGSDSMRAFREAADQGDDALRQFVAQQFKGAGWKCDEAVSGIKESKDFYAGESVQVKVPHLYNGRFVLVGDSGYAPGPTGTGTSLAMAGAYLLAGEIREHEGDLPAALESYERRMRPLINDLQKMPPFLSSILAPQTAWGIWLRNMVFAFVTRSGVVGFVQKYIAGAFAKADEYPLPEYNWYE